MEIRDIRAGDLEQAALLEQACFSDPWSFEGLKEAMTTNGDLFVAAVENAQVIGYCCVYAGADQGELVKMAVSPAFRRRHVGARLLACVQARCVSKNIREIFLEVRRSNEPARALYTSGGFLPVGVRRNFYQAPTEDAIVMAWQADNNSH